MVRLSANAESGSRVSNLGDRGKPATVRSWEDSDIISHPIQSIWSDCPRWCDRVPNHAHNRPRRTQLSFLATAQWHSAWVQPNSYSSHPQGAGVPWRRSFTGAPAQRVGGGGLPQTMASYRSRVLARSRRSLLWCKCSAGPWRTGGGALGGETISNFPDQEVPRWPVVPILPIPTLLRPPRRCSSNAGALRGLRVRRSDETKRSNWTNRTDGTYKSHWTVRLWDASSGVSVKTWAIGPPEARLEMCPSLPMAGI